MRCFLLLLIGCASLSAQEGQAVQRDLLSDDRAAPTAALDPYVPLTLAQNYDWSVHQIFSSDRLFLIAARAAIDTARDDPAAWGQGAEGYAIRVASRLGRVAVRENLAFAVRAFDHEDPRYFRSTQTGVWRRARHAVGHTFVAGNERGGTMPAYSVLLSEFATPFIAQTWRPESVNTGRDLRGGVIGIGMTAVNNVGQEFWPDIRKKLRR